LVIKHDEQDYSFRMIILFDHGLFHRKQESLSQRVEKTQQAFDQLSSKLNTYRLQSEILAILDVPKYCYSYEYLFDSS
jgi:hypothetical protein